MPALTQVVQGASLIPILDELDRINHELLAYFDLHPTFPRMFQVRYERIFSTLTILLHVYEERLNNLLLSDLRYQPPEWYHYVLNEVREYRDQAIQLEIDFERWVYH